MVAAVDVLPRKDGPDKGIIPLTCMELFERVKVKTDADPNVRFTVEVSYIEVRTAHHPTHRDPNHSTFHPLFMGIRSTTRKFGICSIPRTQETSGFVSIQAWDLTSKISANLSSEATTR